ncbi:MAG: hypothetical protein QM796_00330 [Chthoniobacteraceae bacterium]
MIVDSSAFYAFAGYADHPRASLAPGECSLRVDMSPYRSIAVDVETCTPGTVVVEGSPFGTWRADQEAWREVATLDFDRASRSVLALPPADAQYRTYRFRNAASAPVEFRHALFSGRP